MKRNIFYKLSVFLGAQWLFMAVRGLHEGDDDPGGSEVDDEILDGIKTMQKSQKKTDESIEGMLKNIGNLDGKTKKALEELTTAKNQYKGLSQDIQSVSLAMKKVTAQLEAERRNAFGSPVQRIIADEEKRNLMGGLIRAAVPGATLSDEQQKAVAQYKALTGGATPGSTYLPGEQLITDLYDTMGNFGIWNGFDVKDVSTRTWKFPVKTARPIAKVFGEGVPITPDTNKAGASLAGLAVGIKVLLEVANEFLQDSAIPVEADILEDFLEAVAERLDHFCLKADGTNDELNGGMTGIFEGGTASVVAAATTVETTTLADWMKVLLTVDPAVLSRPCRWWMHPQILVRTLGVQDDNKRPLFQTALEAPSPGGIGSILGYPVTLAHAAPNANAADAKVAGFGDPRGNVVGVRRAYEFASSEHAGFGDYETAFRGVTRGGSKIRRAQAFGIQTLAAA